MATKTYGTTSTSWQPQVTDLNGYVVSSFTPDDWGGNSNPQESRELYVVTRIVVYGRAADADASSGSRTLKVIMGRSPGGTDKASSSAYNTYSGSASLGSSNAYFAGSASAVLGSTTEYYAGALATSTSGFLGTRTAPGASPGDSVYANSVESANSQQYLSFDYYGLPNAPSGLSSTTTGTSSVSLSWTASTTGSVAAAPDRYKVQYKQSSSSTWIDFTTTTSTSTSVTGLSPSTTYNFRVAGENTLISSVVSGATGTWSSTASATTESDVPPVPAPTWSGSFNSGTVNTSYVTDYARATGHDTAYGNISIVSGSLPPGLGGSPSGEYYYVSGTPTTSGSYSFTLRATNAGGTSDQAYSIYISPLAAPSWVDQALATSGTVGDYYSDSVSATNVTSWSYSGVLPSGTVFSNGSLYGTLTSPGSFSFTITASNVSGSTQRSFTITVDSALLNGGNRMTGSSSSTPLTTYKRYSGSSWIDLTVAKRFNGSTWEDI